MSTAVAGVDLVTGKALVVLQERPVVGLASWLLDAAIVAEHDELELQLVTPGSTRVTYPLRSQLLGRPGVRWVVDDHDEHGPYDGVSGARLTWSAGHFAELEQDPQSPVPAPAWLRKPDRIHANLHLVARVRYEPVETVVVGAATEYLFRALTGGPPAGWGTEEPVSQPWDPATLTRFCRRWTPRPTLLPVVGQPPTEGSAVHPGTGTVEVVVRPAGLEEVVSVAVGYDGLLPPGPDELEPVVRELAERFELVSLVAIGTGAEPDTTMLSRFTGLPGPIGLALGPEARVGLGAGSDQLIAGGAGQSIGDDTGLWFPVGTGRSAADWQEFALLIRRLTTATGYQLGRPAPAPASTFRLPG